MDTDYVRKLRKIVVVSEMSHKTDNNGFKKGTDFGFFL